MHTFDFTRSYIRFRIDSRAKPAITVTHAMPTTVNNVRIGLECRCELFDTRTSRSFVYVLGASCKTERVGADKDCWLEPNADFCLAASELEFLTLKSWARNGLLQERHPAALGEPKERQSGECKEAWADFSIQTRTVRGRQLTTIDDIIAAIRGDRPIVSRTVFNDGQYRVIIEHPVKTINYSERENVYQTDTGPILLPDLRAERLSRSVRLIDCFDLAYSAFNSEGWAEFIVNVPTPIGSGLSVNHFSQPRRVEQTHNLLVEVLDESKQEMPQLADDRYVRIDGIEAIPPASQRNGSQVAQR